MIIIFCVLSKPPSNLHEKTHRDVTCLMLRRKRVFIAHGEAKYCDKARRQTLFTDETEKNTLLTGLTEMAVEQMFDSQLHSVECALWRKARTTVCNVHMATWHGHDMWCCKRVLRGGH